MRNSIPRVAAIHDISGLGRSSLTAAIPVLSSMGIQPIPLPTAVLSTQTVGTSGYSFLDLTDNMRAMLDHWVSMNERFDGVYSGFMACPSQMETVARCIGSCMDAGGLALVDPVLGEDGKLIPTMTPAMVEKMRWLIERAQIITPNYTEVCLLLGEPCGPSVPSIQEQKEYLKRLSDLGPKVVIGTSMPLTSDKEGIPQRSSVLAYERDLGAFWRVDCSYIPAEYPGTGDIFASVVMGALVLGESLSIAIDKAVQFVTLGVRATFGQDVPATDGILLERYLPTLRQPVSFCQCSLER